MAKYITLNTKERGIGLIEVMVALVLLAINVLGFMAVQTYSLKKTSETIEQTSSLSLMRDLAEKIRANPDGMEDYVKQVNKTSISAPSKKCGLDGNAPGSCTAEELAIAEVYEIKKSMKKMDVSLGMVVCPGTKNNGLMETNCLIAAWSGTKPTAGTSASGGHCIEATTGVYFRRSNCVMMDVF